MSGPSAATEMRHATAYHYGKPMSANTCERLVTLLEARYPGCVRRSVEVCPDVVIKIIDNEADALLTIRNLESAERCPDGR